MKKPHIIVHMMMALDGRIDCGMTAQLAGNAEYYATLAALDAPSRVTGSTTAASELAAGAAKASAPDPIGKEAFAKHQTAPAYSIIADSHGKTNWNAESNSSYPHLILTSTTVSRAYLADLDRKHISWIATGTDHVDLKRAMTLLATEFGVDRLAVVGGGTINGGFLAAGLVDELSVVIGPGVDGRTGQPALFDGLVKGSRPLALTLKAVKAYPDDAVWLRYTVNH